jgi:hypothetical protein
MSYGVFLNWVQKKLEEGWQIYSCYELKRCRRLNIPIRDYMASVLPGLADRPISQTTELTPAAWGNRNRSSTLLPSTAVSLVRRLPFKCPQRLAGESGRASALCHASPSQSSRFISRVV